MRISQEVLNKVRMRASFACEYCGVQETDTGGELTVDHFQPQSLSGSDDLDNLVYACFRCNIYKSAYWHELDTPSLWNPRNEPASSHFMESEDGNLVALSEIGVTSIRVLRLNRPALVKYRLTKRENLRRKEILERLLETVRLHHSVKIETMNLTSEQSNLLSELKSVFDRFTNSDE
ncbi:MAG: HNH endonuclease [Fimbriimonadia bacterium]|nr:HNH endonuclease [Fimbriimonadia bacterium]